MILFEVKLQWIKSEFGGRSQIPRNGSRVTIRFQRHVEKWLQSAWDVEVVACNTTTDTLEGTAKLALIKEESPSARFICQDELFELLDAYRVIAVGKIVRVDGSE